VSRLVVAGLLIGLPAAAVGYAYEAQPPPPDYITATIERGSISSAVKASGSVEPVMSVDVSSQLSGRIADVYVDYNDSVKAGQPLARLDQGIYAAHVNETTAALMVANAKLQLAEAAVERAKTGVDNARTSYRISESPVGCGAGSAEREPQRQATLARTGRRSSRNPRHRSRRIFARRSSKSS